MKGLMLKTTNCRGYWKKHGVYEDCVVTIRYSIRKFGATWRQHVHSNL